MRKRAWSDRALSLPNWNLGNTATTTTTLVYDNNGNLTAYGTANGTTTYT